MRTITLLTPIPVMNPTKDLSKVFSQMSGITNPDGTVGTGYLSNSCIQENFSVLTQWGGDGAPINSKKFQILTERLSATQSLGNAITNGSQIAASDWLNGHSALTGPITVSVPNNQNFTIAIRGVLEVPDAVNAVNTPCAKADTTYRTPFIIYEKKEVPSNSPNVIAIRPNVLRASFGQIPYSTPSPPSAPGGSITPLSQDQLKFQCRDSSNSRTCANIDVIELYFTYGFTSAVTNDPNIRLRQTLSEIDEVIPLPVNNYAYVYISTLRNYLIRYQQNSGQVSVMLDPNAHTLKYTNLSGQIVQPLTYCNGMYQGNLPLDNTPATTSTCGGTYNFTMKYLGENFE